MGFGRRCISLVLTLLLVSAAFGSELFLSIPRERISDIIFRMYNLDPSVESDVKDLISAYPDSPVGPLLESGRLFMLQNYAMVDPALREAFENHTKEALKTAKSSFRENRESPEARYCLGMLELGIARYHIDRRHWFRALFKAKSGLRHLRKILETYPDFHDAKLAFGMANCYLDDAPSYLRPFAMLFGFKGDMETGLIQLDEVKKNGLFLTLESSANLAEIHWFLREDRAAARRELEFLIQECPDNVMFLRMIGVLERAEKRNDVAHEYFKKALSKPQIDQFQRLRTELLLKTGEIHHGNGDFDSALQYANRAIQSSEDGRTLRWIRSWAFLLRAASLHGAGRLEEARTAYLEIKESENSSAFKRAQTEIEKLDA